MNFADTCTNVVDNCISIRAPLPRELLGGSKFLYVFYGVIELRGCVQDFVPGMPPLPRKQAFDKAQHSFALGLAQIE